MACCLPDDARKVCGRCHAIELFCKSVSTAQLPTGTICIADAEHGYEHEKVFSVLVPKAFACDWQRLFPRTRKPKSFVSSSTKSRLQRKTESYAGSRCVVLRAEVSLSPEPI